MKSLHETDDQLELFALDRLPEDAIERIEEHLLICDSCRLRMTEIGEFTYDMRDALKAMPTGPVPKRRGWFEGWNLQLGFAGAVALALLLAFVAYRNSNELKLPPVTAITLTAMRGETAVAAQARKLDVTLRGAVGQNLSLTVVDAAGAKMWAGTADAKDGVVHTRVGRVLAPGTYFVRLKSSTGELLHEYGFEVRP